MSTQCLVVEWRNEGLRALGLYTRESAMLHAARDPNGTNDTNVIVLQPIITLILLLSI